MSLQETDEIKALKDVAAAAREVVRQTKWKRYDTKSWCDTEVRPMKRLVDALVALGVEE